MLRNTDDAPSNSEERAEVVLPRPIRWLGSAKADWMEFPAVVQDVFGYALHSRYVLHQVQMNGTPAEAKPLAGNLRGVWELRESFQTDAYRAYYVVLFPRAVYVLHSHKKKSKRGGSLPQEDEWLLMKRFKRAAMDYENEFGNT